MTVSKILLIYLYSFNNKQIISVLTVEILMQIVNNSYGPDILIKYSRWADIKNSEVYGE